MRVFVTGASGFIGSAVVPELLEAGHEVVGLARSDASAAAITTLGAGVHRGDLDDLDGLRAAAAASDGVVHLAFVHDFSRYDASLRIDLEAIEAMGTALEGSDRPFVIASGVGFVALAAGKHPELEARFPRSAAGRRTVQLAEHGVRSVVVGLPPTVHGAGDHGFIATLVGIAREKGVSGFVGDGSNRWSAVDRFDAAHLFRLTVERAAAGSVFAATADEGVPLREIAEIIGRHVGVPTASIASEDAAEHFGWLGTFVAIDTAASSEQTYAQLGWQPTRPGLVEDLEQGHYFE
jgi:nucleoside-diphosphate-sugar epimerase